MVGQHAATMTTKYHSYYKLTYPDPWAYCDQPKLKHIDRGWFRRDKFQLVESYMIKLPPPYAYRVDQGIVTLPALFTCDLRSTPLGKFLVRDHAGGLLHDFGYRLPEWYELIKKSSQQDRLFKYGMTERDVVAMHQLLLRNRKWWDDLFYDHLKAVGKQQSFIALDPRKTRAAHAIARPPQWLAVRMFGSIPWQERYDFR